MDSDPAAWRYLKDDAALNAFLLERAVEKRQVRTAAGHVFEGPKLARLIQRLVAFSRLLDLVEKKGTPRALVELLLRGQVKDAEGFTDKTRLLELIRPLREGGADVVLEKDEEHGVFEVVLQTSHNGHPREVRVGDDLVASAEYRVLFAAYDELRELDAPPLTVVDGGETRVATRQARVDHILAEGRRQSASRSVPGLRFRGLERFRAAGRALAKEYSFERFMGGWLGLVEDLHRERLGGPPAIGESLPGFGAAP